MAPPLRDGGFVSGWGGSSLSHIPLRRLLGAPYHVDL